MQNMQIPCASQYENTNYKHDNTKSNVNINNKQNLSNENEDDECQFKNNCRDIACEKHSLQFIKERFNKLVGFSAQCTDGINCFLKNNKICHYQHPPGYKELVDLALKTNPIFKNLTNKCGINYKSRSASAPRNNKKHNK
jgi:hypothetical protein